MIYGLALLSLVGSSWAANTWNTNVNLRHSASHDVEHVKKARVIQSPADFITRNGFQGNQKLKEEARLAAQQFHEQVTPINHRELHKDNFLMVELYDDEGCENTPTVQGYLLNYCFNTYDGYSYLIKANTHQESFVQLNYFSEFCTGIPDHMIDLPRLGGFEHLGDCGAQASVRAYVMPEYPIDFPSGLLSTYYTSCEHQDEYFAFQFLPLGVCFGRQMVDSCSYGYATFAYYFDEECMTYDMSYDYANFECGITYPGYDGKENDDKEHPLTQNYMSYQSMRCTNM